LVWTGLIVEVEAVVEGKEGWPHSDELPDKLLDKATAEGGSSW